MGRHPSNRTDESDDLNAVGLAGRLRADGVVALVSPDDYTRYTYTPQRLFDMVVRKDQAEKARQIAARYANR